MEEFTYYFLMADRTYRGFKLKVFQHSIVIERKYPRKDSQLSRKRGVKYKLEKTGFDLVQPVQIEHLGCKQIKLNQLAPCNKEHTDPIRTIQIPESTQSINLHLFTLEPGQEHKLEKYDTSKLGKRLYLKTETNTYPNIGIIVTS